MNKHVLLKDLMSLHEKYDLEFKESVNSKEIGKTSCAFANTEGGFLVFGMSDHKVVKGLTGNLDSLQQTIANVLKQINPMPLHTLTLDKENGKNIMILQIHKIGEVICSFDGKIYARIGSTTQKLEGHALTEFLKEKNILCFDTISSKATEKDIIKEKVIEYLKKRSLEINTPIKTVLLNLQVATQNGKFIIKNAGVLAFCKIENFFPQNEVRLVKFSGTLPVDVEKTQLLNTNPKQVIEQIMDFIKSNIKTELGREQLERKEIPEYPISVLREAIVNSIAHRDYFSFDQVQISIFSNRIEITNPGSLPRGLGVDKLGTLSVKRNPLTYRILRDFGFMEGMGTGIPSMINEMRRNGLPDPLFENLEGFFKVTLYNKQLSNTKVILNASDLNSRQTKGLAYLTANKNLTAKTYAEINKISIPTAVKDLNELVKFNFINKSGRGKATEYLFKDEK